MNMYNWFTLLCTWNNTALYINYTPNKNKKKKPSPGAGVGGKLLSYGQITVLTH